MNLIQDKILQLDSDIIHAAEHYDSKIASSKVMTKKLLKKILIKRQKAEEIQQSEKNKYLLEDDVYTVAKQTKDTKTMRQIENRTLTKQQYQILSIKYGVNNELWKAQSQERNNNYEYLFNQEGMTSEDTENMKISVNFLIKNSLDTFENIKKLLLITYSSRYREIAGIKFARTKIIPEVKFNKKINEHNYFASKKKGMYKTIYKDIPHYHCTVNQYQDEMNKQGKTAITVDHINRVLQALPGGLKNEYDYHMSGNIIANILDIPTAGFLDGVGNLCFKDGLIYIII